jgi:hypothetical protein
MIRGSARFERTIMKSIHPVEIADDSHTRGLDDTLYTLDAAGS